MLVQELCDRYNLNSRKSLYRRLNGLGITLAKEGNKSYATEEQIALLDQQNEHIKKGGSIDNFEPVKTAEVTIHDSTTQHNGNLDISSLAETTLHSTQLQVTPQLLTDIVQAVSHEIASKMTPASPLWFMCELERARASGWELTTSQVKDLIGVKPRCNEGKKTFKRGSFIFVKSGKIGNQTSWKVQKVTEV